MVVPWTPKVESDLLWWFDTDHLLQGVSLEVQHPDLLFWPDALDRVGRPSLRPICLGSLVGQGALSVSQPPRFSSYTPGAPVLQLLSEGHDGGCLHRQYNSPVFCQEAREDIFRGAQPGGATSPPVSGINRPVSGSPVYRGVPECSSRPLEPSSTGLRFGVNPSSGGSGRDGSEVAGDCRSFRHCPQLPTPGLFLSPLRSHGSGHGCLSSGVGWPPGVRLSTVCADSPGPEQADLVHWDLSTLIAPFWPWKEWFPELQSLAVAPPVLLPTHRDLLKQPHFHRLHQNLHVLSLHAWRLFNTLRAT